MTTFKESKHNHNIIALVNKKDFYEKQYDENINPKGYIFHMGLYQMHVYRALIDRLAEKNFKETITLTMKENGHHITINPCSQGDIQSVEDIEYYLIDDKDADFELDFSGDSLAEIAGILAHYHDFYIRTKEETMDEKAKLRAYYHKHLDKSEQLCQDARNLCSYLCNHFEEKNSDVLIENFSLILQKNKQVDDSHLEEIKAYVKDLYEYINHAEFYSDWHKDIYGYRPR